jgi:hypothetical protein
MLMINPYDIKYELQEKLSRLFWIEKQGFYPTKVEKIVRKISLKQFGEESELIYKEYTEFVNKYLNDPVFRAKFN